MLMKINDSNFYKIVGRVAFWFLIWKDFQWYIDVAIQMAFSNILVSLSYLSANVRADKMCP